MSYKPWLTAFFLLVTILFFDAQTTSACSCVGKGTVLDAYDQADVVIVAKVVSRERQKGSSDSADIASTRMVIERVFKGNLKVDDQVLFAQGEGNDCIWGFGADDIGKEFLFYVRSSGNKTNLWYASICGRSNRLEFAADDMLYLDKIDKVRGKSRISGTVRFYKETSLGVDHRKIRIIGKNKTLEIETDKDGVYEIYDLQPGAYQIEFDVPDGWKWPRYSPNGKTSKAEGAKLRGEVVLEGKKHARFDIDFEIDNVVRGTVYGPNGKPMREVCVSVFEVQSDRQTKFDYTDENGVFEISELNPGNYVLVINDDGKITSRQPFPKLYYPNVRAREEASIFSVREGEKLDEINIHVSAVVETITLEGTLLYDDGKPVTDAFVQFEYEQNIKKVDEEEVHVKTDPNGHFLVPILKGTKGKLFGLMYSYVGKYENCPKLDRQVEQAGGSVAEIKTAAIEIDAKDDMDGIKLKFAFPKCNKAKDPG